MKAKMHFTQRSRGHMSNRILYSFIILYVHLANVYSKDIDLVEILQHRVNLRPICLLYLNETQSNHDFTKANTYTGVLCVCEIKFSPPELERIPENQERTVALNHTCDISEPVYISLSEENIKVAKITSERTLKIETNLNASNAYTNNSFRVKGVSFGRTVIKVTSLNSSRSRVLDYRVSVVRVEGIPTLIFAVVLGTLILFMNTGFGCKIELSVIKGILKKPVGPIIGFCCQFLIMAPLAFGIAKLLQLDNVSGLGLLTIGACPGGGGSNIFAYLLNADLELSITMTFISTLAAMVMTPFWLWALGRFFTGGNASRVRIPVVNVLISLSIVVVPVLLGVFIAHFAPKVSRVIIKLLRPFIVIMGLSFVGLGVYVYWYALSMATFKIFAAAMLVPFFGYLLGALIPFLFRLESRKVVTISIETGFQNISLALMMLRISLPVPEADFAGVLPIMYMFLGSLIPVIAFIVRLIWKRCYKDKTSGEIQFSYNETDDECTRDSQISEMNSNFAYINMKTKI